MIEFIGLMLSCAIRIHQPINFTIADFELMCKCVDAEAGGESMECQIAVATVILNRAYCTDKFADNIEGVITADHQFVISKTPVKDIPDDVKLSVLNALITYGSLDQRLPKSCYYFRAVHYHNFGIPYTKIGKTYFSLAENATD